MVDAMRQHMAPSLLGEPVRSAHVTLVAVAQELVGTSR
jgi:hypothetical protein